MTLSFKSTVLKALQRPYYVFKRKPELISPPLSIFDYLLVLRIDSIAVNIGYVADWWKI